jgi:hypothetical protein
VPCLATFGVSTFGVSTLWLSAASLAMMSCLAGAALALPVCCERQGNLGFAGFAGFNCRVDGADRLVGRAQSYDLVEPLLIRIAVISDLCCVALFKIDLSRRCASRIFVRPIIVENKHYFGAMFDFH